jgi:cytochrome P450
MASVVPFPGPRGRPIIGHLPTFREDPIHFLQRCAREYGDIVHFKLGTQAVYLLNHPDYIKDVLVTHQRNFIKGRGLERAKRMLGEGLLTSEHEFHRRQRRLAQPAFHRQRIAQYGTVMAAYSARRAERWSDGEERDVAEEMMRLTLAIVGKTLFDADVEGEAAEIGAALTAAMQLFQTVTLPFADLLDRLPTPANRRFREARARLDATIYRMIAERRSSGEDRGDFLSMLLRHVDADTDERMSDEQLRDEALTIFLAGHETTANALTWTWYLLSQHPEVEQQLHAELHEALGGRLPAVDDLARLPYTEMVLHEAMRLYPPAWILGRRALSPYPVAGHVVPAGGLILMSQYVMHHDARFFPDPYRFDPLRWTAAARAERPKFSYFPFGGGPRQCIGESFAWMEGILAIATIARRWRMRLVPGHPVEMLPLVTLRPRHGMRMRIEARGSV